MPSIAFRLTTVFMAISILGMPGCAAHRATDPAIVTSWDYTGDPEVVWKAAIKVATDMELDIASIESVRNVITTNWQVFDLYRDYASCTAALPDVRATMRHTITMTSAVAGPRLSIESQYLIQRNSGAGPITTCTTTGVFERRFNERLAKEILD